mmetsp:Transcript_40297/g.47144  ORF Transcript_40297/g.47144 Transcript_40297/m.47144 type:complete len:93 (-) Transcript_40297:86-364(-)|eukprot:CAMPEP_0194377922 /NCGR_PEP_ID=MMETSP0174-20130528/33008_1 /TAXON_ID=216777 /ORGANISM="Proboscia alata, Strain PI-D3" /LENGTH=92 /DNA_ID=CAMNT_0039159585 /DNA_START=101 /DNA_END=379 /DNA_ORIENTATION=-
MTTNGKATANTQLPARPKPSQSSSKSRRDPFKERDSDNPNPGGGISGMPAPHRPMVGGFAAAAYEAAREFHFKVEQNPKIRKDRDTRPPPSI